MTNPPPDPHRASMFDHVKFGVTDFAASKAFVIDPDGHNIELVCHQPQVAP